MRSALINHTPFFYAVYSGKTYAEKDGKKTGEQIITYGSVVKKTANISASRGQADPQLFGVDLRYSKTITYTENLPIDETTAIWLDINAFEYVTTTTYQPGAFVFHSGKIYKCKSQTTGAWDSTKWDEMAHNYEVVGVAKSLNSTILAVRKLN